MSGQTLRPLPLGMTAQALWALPNGTLTDHSEGAHIAPWRPWLEISWRKGATLTLVMMNPSAATATQLDATVRNALYQALRLDIEGQPIGRLIVVNAFDIRATTLNVKTGRAEVQLEQDGERVTIGEGLSLCSTHCDRYIREAVEAADLVVCGWGAKVGEERTRALLSGPLKGVPLHAWRLSGDRAYPKHPRAQNADQMPALWVPLSMDWAQLGQPAPDLMADDRLSLRPEAEKPSKSLRRMARDGAIMLRLLDTADLESCWRWM